MSIKRYSRSLLKPFILLSVCVAIVIYAFPYLFSHAISWQREFNQLISSTLHQIKENTWQAGGLLVGASFIYGVLHAVGPGHGKFIIGSYLATHPSKLKQSMWLTFLASLMQSLVAIVATSIVVVGLKLSSRYFTLSQIWLERVAYILVLIIAIQWLYQGLRKLIKNWPWRNKIVIKSIQANSLSIMTPSSISMNKIGQSSSNLSSGLRSHHTHCGCGHQHLPSQEQIEESQNIKDKLLIILSIGMRPCSGAIFILFLAYMLDLYIWGMLATLVMGLGVGLTLSAFALIVQYARGNAIKLGKWYVSPHRQIHLESIAKLVAGIVLLCFSGTLLYATTLPIQGGAVLFGH